MQDLKYDYAIRSIEGRLSHFSYENFLKSGRGIIIIKEESIDSQKSYLDRLGLISLNYLSCIEEIKKIKAVSRLKSPMIKELKSYDPRSSFLVGFTKSGNLVAIRKVTSEFKPIHLYELHEKFFTAIDSYSSRKQIRFS